MAFGGYLFTTSSYALPSAGIILLPGSDPRRKPLTSGHSVFGLCRHPQYAGLFALCLSICLVSQSADRLFYTLLLMIVLDKKADLEEMSMVETHPEYARYLLQVPKFMPNLTAVVRGSAGAQATDAAADDAATSLLHGAGRSSGTSLLHGSSEAARRGTKLPPHERERLERLAATPPRTNSNPGRLMDAHYSPALTPQS